MFLDPRKCSVKKSFSLTTVCYNMFKDGLQQLKVKKKKLAFKVRYGSQHRKVVRYQDF